MSQLIINHEMVRSSVAELKNKTNTNLSETAATSYDNLIAAVSGSKGDYHTGLLVQLQKEKEFVAAVAAFFNKALDLIQATSDAFEETDKIYEAELIKFL